MNPDNKRYDHYMIVAISLLGGIIIILCMAFQSLREEYLKEGILRRNLDRYVTDTGKYIYEDYEELRDRVTRVEDTLKGNKRR